MRRGIPLPAVPLPALWVIAVTLVCAVWNAWGAFRSDEVWSIRVVSQPYAQMISDLRADVHPPLYFHLLRWWGGLFGFGEWSVHLLSGLLYLLAVLAFYMMAIRLLRRETAVLATVIFLASPLNLLAANFGRMYSLLSLVSVALTWVYLECLRQERPAPRALLLYATVIVLGSFTHIWFFFLLFAQLAHHVISRRGRPSGRLALAVGGALVPYSVLWLPTLVRQVSDSGNTAAWLQPPGWNDVQSVVLMQGGAFWLLVPLALFYWWRKRDPRVNVKDPAGPATGPGILLSLLALTLTVPFAISYVKPVFYSRFTIVGLPLFALLSAVLMERWLGRARQQFSQILAALTCGFLGLSALIPPECDSRWTANYLREHARPGDMAIFTSLSRMPTDHYLDQQRQRAGAEERVLSASFPAEIDDHPGFEGDIRNPARFPAFAAEAERVAATASRRAEEVGGIRLFFFHGKRPATDAVLGQVLADRFERDETLCVACNLERNYYKQITVYKVSATDAPRPRLSGWKDAVSDAAARGAAIRAASDTAGGPGGSSRNGTDGRRSR